MSDAGFFAMLCDMQLRTDSTATPESRTFFSSEAPIQHLIEESSLTFAPGLADVIRSRNTPSVQQLRACSVLLSGDDLKLKWIIYLQYYRQGPLWAIYCGKTTNARDAQERLLDYENENSNIANSIKDLLKRGFKRTSHTNLAVVDIPFEGEDMIYVTHSSQRLRQPSLQDSLKEAYRTDEEFRDGRLHYSKQYTADGKQAIARAKYKASQKYESRDAAYRNSEKGKASKNKSQAKRHAAVKAKSQLKAEEEGS